MQVNIPQNGQRVALFCNGKYVGKTKGKFQQIGLVSQLDSHQMFTIETNGVQHAFKQQVSHMYIGGDVNNGRTPLFVDKRDSCQQHFLQSLNTGEFRIRSIKNTYLCNNNSKLIWKSNPQNTQCIWKLQYLSGSPINNKQYSILPINCNIYFYNNHGIIGKRRGLKQALQTVNQLKQWQYFIAVKSSNENKIGLKQVISGYFMGHNANHHQPVCLTSCFLGNQQFTIEDRGNYNISIRNNNNNFIGLKDGKKVVFKRDLDQTCLWRFQIINQSQKFPTFQKGYARITQIVY